MILEPNGKDYSDVLNKINFSFSSVNSYRNCPRCFWLSYLQNPRLVKENNAFAQWGSFMHEIFEKFYTGKLDFFDVCLEYENNYKNKVDLKFPANKFVDLNKSYYQAGLNALELFDELPDNIEILDVECRITTTINDVPFVGFADLILHNKDTDDIYVIDHKSKNKFKSKTEQKEYARQLYLYSLYVKDKYGKYPSHLIFNMFRIGETVTIPFVEHDLSEAIDWFTSTVAEIYMDLEFLDKIVLSFRKTGKDIATFDKQDYFCNQLCGVRKYCPRANTKSK